MNEDVHEVLIQKKLMRSRQQVCLRGYHVQELVVTPFMVQQRLDMWSLQNVML